MNKITEKDIQTIDCVNLGVGIIVILAAVFTFWNGAVKTFMFPVIFVLGSFMNCMWGVKKAGVSKPVAVGCFAVAAFLFVMAVLQAI